MDKNLKEKLLARTEEHIKELKVDLNEIKNDVNWTSGKEREAKERLIEIGESGLAQLKERKKLIEGF